MPRELNAVARELDGLKKTIKEASRKKKQPPNLANAKNYVTYMSQVSKVDIISTFWLKNLVMTGLILLARNFL